MFRLGLASLMLFSTSSLWASFAAPNSSCLFLFEGNSVSAIPQPQIIAHGLATPDKYALTANHRDCTGRTQYIIERSVIRLRSFQPSGEMRSELAVHSSGNIYFTNFFEGFRNRAQIGSEVAEILISKLAGDVRAKGRHLEAAGKNLYHSLQTQKPLLFKRRAGSTPWPRSQKQPLNLKDLQKLVGREYLHAFGTTRLIFDPYLERLTFEKKLGNNKRQEMITLSSEGETIRIQASGQQPLRSYMDRTIAQGIIRYALNSSSGDELHFATTLSKLRDFIFAELPELFEQEMHKRTDSTIYVETDLGELMTFVINNQPKPFNPQLDLNQ